MSAAQGEGADVQAAPSPHPRARSLALVGWLIATAAGGFPIWLFYALTATPLFPNCGSDFLWGSYEGGAASGSSLTAAAVLGSSLWLAAGLAAWLLRRKLRLLFVSFVALYVVGLAVLWHASPLFWGPRHCV